MEENKLNIKNILPIKESNYTLRLLDRSDIDWYLYNCKQPYYNKYLDWTYSKLISDNNIITYLNYIIESYKLNETNEIRAVYESNNGKLVAACTATVTKDNTKNICLAYFVEPKYQSKNIGYTMLNTFIQAIFQSDLQFKDLIVIIQQNNIRSLTLAKRLGFTEKDRYIGKVTTNIIMTMQNKE